MSNDSTSTDTAATAKRVVEVESGGPDVYAAFQDIVEHPAKKWTAKAVPSGEEPKDWIVSEHVSGIVDYIETRDGDFGAYRVIELKRKDGSRLQLAGFGTVLSGWFRTLRIGDGLAITYRGTKPSTNPGFKDFDDFEVVVVRDGRRISRDESSDEEIAFEEDNDLPMASDA